MASSFKWLLAALLAVAATAASAADPSVRLRYMSFVLRDQPPTIDEAKALAHGETTIDALVETWLGSAEHKARIERYFDDMFGVREWVDLMSDEFVLAKSDGGAYHLPSKAACSGGQVVDADAWWTDQKVSMCANSTSATLKVTSGGTTHACGGEWDDGIQFAGCGCGPKQILCIPEELVAPLRNEVRREFAVRGGAAYAEDMTWTKLFADPFGLGTRSLYWYYLFQTKLVERSITPSAGDWSTLAAVPMEAKTAWSMPSGEERAGIATMAGFLKQRNNFRSRIRGLTQSLLCQDIDATLNTDNIATFINPDLDASDLAHGHKPGCQECHYPMDNMGSTLLNWDTNGDRISWKDVELSGHVFGETGSGPGFLVKGYVERHPNFFGCQAKRAWEDFSGKAWDLLAATERAEFEVEARKGPRALLQAIFRSAALKAVPGGDQ